MTDTTTQPKTYRPFIDVILQAAGNPTLPDGYDTWGFKITRPDLRTYGRGGGRYRWPWPGGTVTDTDTVVNGQPCPTSRTGGFCIAKTLAGAASGGYGHATILLLAYRLADMAGEDADKRRVSHCLVADVIDGREAYRVAAGADLARADLAGADLAGAYLAGAYLAGAYLAGADLAGAYLAGADLAGAYLAGANLADANLARAYLTRADLAGAYLAGAYLARANLADANLAGANLADANLAGANLADARNLDQAIGYKPVTSGA
jgi:pentapeptide repeat protein